ncbi:CHASE2 and HATPase_c domain-containing protein [Halomonas sp. MS1]|nr:CHASE2 and HATPase_c domain-containing protein [Halomonas sp. MS1]UTD56172.1 CHASE2 and HATPase_c domain-containing protein [Halomonas sp. MS1]
MTQGSNLSRALHRRFVMTWCVMGSLLLPIAFFLYSLSPFLSDNFFYDAWLSRQSEPPSNDILVVAIDEPSLQTLGRWPWPREIHTQLIDQLNTAGVHSIVLDVLLVEPSRLPEEDRRLAEAMHRHGRTYLPMALLPESILEGRARDVLIPPPPLLSAAKGVGHINVKLDTDGVARSVELLIERREDVWPQLMTLLVDQNKSGGAGTSNWSTEAIRIPFRGPSGSYPTVSYRDVLMGYVPASLLQGRTVLVGMTALGLGDRYNVSLLSSGLMPGVEVHAHLLDALRNETYIREVDSWIGAFLASLPIVVLMLLAWWLRFRYLPLVMLSLVAGVLCASLIALNFRWWWPPFASLIALGIAIIAIVWQSQAALLSWFKRELELLYQEPSILPFRQPDDIRGEGGKLYQQSQALEFALGRIVEGRRFILDAMHSLPLPIFILNKKGEVLLANKKALAICCKEGKHAIDHIDALPSFLTFEEERGFSTIWPPQPTGMSDVNGIQIGGLCTDRDEHTYRLEMGELSTTTNSAAGGWLVWLVDLTSEVEAEAQRSSMLSFLSHDMKAPQARALAFLEAQKDPASATTQANFYNHLEQCLTMGLGMINDFINLTRVKSFDLKREFVLFEDVVMEVLDQVYPLAKVKDIKLVSELQDEDGAPVLGDKGYLARSVFNLIENAVKYTLSGGEVNVLVCRQGKWVVLQVSDTGVGIEPEEINNIFDDFTRSDKDSVAEGHGLGLALVKTVVAKHGGEIYCESEFGKGSQFTMKLPSCEL